MTAKITLLILSLLTSIGAAASTPPRRQGPLPVRQGAVRVGAVCLWGEDAEALADFYVRVLDLEDSVVDFAGRVRIRLEGAVLFILAGKPLAAESAEPFPLFALTVADLDGVIERLKDLDVRMPHGIEGHGRHRELQFFDPAGNLVELVQDSN